MELEAALYSQFDIGNTVITLGGFESDKLVFVSRISSSLERTDDEYAVSILDAFRLHKVSSSDIAGVIVASVVPPLNSVIEKAIRFVLTKHRSLWDPV